MSASVCSRLCGSFTLAGQVGFRRERECRERGTLTKVRHIDLWRLYGLHLTLGVSRKLPYFRSANSPPSTPDNGHPVVAQSSRVELDNPKHYLNTFSITPTSPSPNGLHTPTAHPLGRRHRPAADLRRCAMSLGQMPDMRMTRLGPSMDPDIPIRRPIPPGGAPPKHCCAPKSRACLHSPQSTTTAASRPVATWLQSYQPCQITARLRPT